LSVPFWAPPAERYPGRLPARTDVLVVGGGITGVSLLHHLRNRRLHATLVERDHLAAGASGRNAGFLLAGVAENYAAAVRTYGRSQAREI
jgi:gamma-glutamylputrescine oxidase